MLNSHSGRAPECNEILLGWLRIANTVFTPKARGGIGNRLRNDRHGIATSNRAPGPSPDSQMSTPILLVPFARVKPSDARVRSKLPHPDSVLGQLGYGKVGQARLTADAAVVPSEIR